MCGVWCVVGLVTGDGRATGVSMFPRLQLDPSSLEPNERHSVNRLPLADLFASRREMSDPYRSLSRKHQQAQTVPSFRGCTVPNQVLALPDFPTS